MSLEFWSYIFIVGCSNPKRRGGESRERETAPEVKASEDLFGGAFRRRRVQLDEVFERSRSPHGDSVRPFSSWFLIMFCWSLQKGQTKHLGVLSKFSDLILPFPFFRVGLFCVLYMFSSSVAVFFLFFNCEEMCI